MDKSIAEMLAPLLKEEAARIALEKEVVEIQEEIDKDKDGEVDDDKKVEDDDESTDDENFGKTTQF